MRLLVVDERPALVLTALKDLAIGDEILYDYGEKNLPWKQSKVSAV